MGQTKWGGNFQALMIAFAQHSFAKGGPDETQHRRQGANDSLPKMQRENQRDGRTL